MDLLKLPTLQTGHKIILYSFSNRCVSTEFRIKELIDFPAARARRSISSFSGMVARMYIDSVFFIIILSVFQFAGVGNKADGDVLRMF